MPLSSDDPTGDAPEHSDADATPASRRTFLRRASVASVVGSAAIVGGPALIALVSPAFRKPTVRDWVKVAEADNVDVGVPVKADFIEASTDAWVESRSLRSVWLYSDDGIVFTAFSGVCTHLGCSVGFDATRKVYHCPCHHGLFDQKTGAVVGGPPPRALDTLEVKVDGGAVFVRYRLYRIGIADKIEA